MSESKLHRRIAILGATSQIARDLIVSFSESGENELHLFARRPDAVAAWLSSAGLGGRHALDGFDNFEHHTFDAIINFVGVGDPAKTMAMGSTIFDVTLQYDELALNYLRNHPACRYLFLSSGSAYGSSFEQPATLDTQASIPLNTLTPSDWYGVAKLHAECRHRARPDLAINDIRVFNYFSRTQDITARFLISDILRAIQSEETLITSSYNIVRDYIGPDDFFRLIMLIISSPPTNDVIDCYTLAPVDKMSLLSAMQHHFGLKYGVSESPAGVNATGVKWKYYSINRHAEKFGYLPSLSSLETVIEESRLIIDV